MRLKIGFQHAFRAQYVRFAGSFFFVNRKLCFAIMILKSFFEIMFQKTFLIIFKSKLVLYNSLVKTLYVSSENISEAWQLT